MSVDLFEERGYCVLTLEDPGPVLEIRERLSAAVREIFGRPDATLEAYHELVGEDRERHTVVQAEVTRRLRAHQWHLDVFRKNVRLFASLLGPDLDAESGPYLRIARPGRSEDNIGLHRDTIYGGSPYEVSVVIPFVEMDAGSALRVEPGSNLKGEGEIPFESVENPDKSVTKGSLKHQLGFLYAPKVLREGYPLNAVPVPLRLGQVLAFGLSTLHGSLVNESSRTRWSCDSRIMNAFAPIKRAKEGVYEPLARSPVTRSAERYLEASRRPRVPSEGA